MDDGRAVKKTVGISDSKMKLPSAGLADGEIFYGAANFNQKITQP